MISICDGHGVGDRRGIDEKDKSNWDGQLVSASVAAEIFCASNAKEIPDLIKQGDLKNTKEENSEYWFEKFVERKKLAQKENMPEENMLELLKETDSEIDSKSSVAEWTPNPIARTPNSVP